MIVFVTPVQSTKMILKFRETHIGNMEKGRKGGTRGGIREAIRGEQEVGRGKGGEERLAAPTADNVAANEKQATIVSNGH